MDQRSVKLEYWTTEDVAVHIPCRVQGGRVVRSLGLGGDELVVFVRVQDWPLPAGPANIDFKEPMALVLAMTGDAPLTRYFEHYYLRQVEPAMISAGAATQASGGSVTAKEVMLRMETLPRYLRGDGRGALLRLGVFNPVKTSGLVDNTAANYKTNAELVNLCVDALGFTIATTPASLNDLPPTGPLDWGNASAIDELEAALLRCGHALSLPNTGSEFEVVELPRTGSAISLDSDVTAALATPIIVADGPSLRSDTIVVTSGTTRTLVLTWRNLTDLEWVWYDAEGHAWKNATETTVGIDPDDLAAFKAGQHPTDTRLREQYSRLFRALRLKSGEANIHPVQAFEPMTFADGTKLGSASAVVVGHAARVGADDQFEPVPNLAADDPVFLGKCEAHTLARVFVLPDDFAYVRGSTDGRNFARAEAAAIAGSKLRVYFAHEAAYDPEYFTTNYFVAAWKVTQPGGAGTALVYTELTGADLTAAINDRHSVKIHDTRLRRVIRYEPGDAGPTEVNLAALKAVALDLVKARASLARSRGGFAVCKGWLNKRPGCCNGAAQRIEWDIDAFTTVFSLNDHEVPQGFMDVLAGEANWSLAAGIGRYFLDGTSVTRTDARSHPAAGRLTGLVTPVAALGGLRAGTPPEARSPERGAEKMAAVSGFSGETPGNKQAPPPNSILAQITGYASIGSNRWEYEWSGVALSVTGVTKGQAIVPASPLTHATYGKAFNLAEAMNDGSGIEGNGVDRGNLPAGWAMQPVPIGSVVTLRFTSTGVNGAAAAYFERSNFDDGECAGGEE